MILHSLNELATQYKAIISKIKFIEELDLSKHVPYTYSVYELQISFHSSTGVSNFWYIGHSNNPRHRFSQHKSNLRNCNVTTFVGISYLFTEEILNVQEITMKMKIVESSLTVKDAKNLEKKHSSTLRSVLGEQVLTNPNGSN
jgi:predicted GIY-YIG superfamily endonuclease